MSEIELINRKDINVAEQSSEAPPLVLWPPLDAI